MLPRSARSLIPFPIPFPMTLFRPYAALAAMLLAACVLSPIRQKSTEPAPPPMLSRSDWGAQPPVLALRSHTPSRITIHHTAQRQRSDRTLAQKLQALQRFSQAPGELGSGRTKPAWADVPYHYYIAVDGQIGEGRDVRFIGDTNTSYDPTGHALVVLEGNFEVEEPTAAQLRSTEQLVGWLGRRFRVPPERLGDHNDFAATACPGRNLEARLPALRAELAHLTDG